MALQVGNACFATALDAGVAACAAFTPVRTITSDGSKLRSVSCSGVDASTGSLTLSVVSTDIGVANASTVETISQIQSYPECIEGQYVDASLQIFGAFLGMAALCYASWCVYRFLTSNSRITE